MALRPGRPLNPVRSSHSASIYRPALPDAGSLLAGAVFPIARIPQRRRPRLRSFPPSIRANPLYTHPDRGSGIHLVNSLADAFFPKVG